MKSTEHVVGENPFTVRRRVKFGDCDPAGVVYTPVFAEYVVSCADLFYEFLLDDRPGRIKDQYGFETPTRALNFDFRSSLRPDDEFEMSVRISDVRTRSYTLEITAHGLQGEALFIASLTPICIARHERRGIEIPAPFRARLEAYRNRLASPH